LLACELWPVAADKLAVLSVVRPPQTVSGERHSQPAPTSLSIKLDGCAAALRVGGGRASACEPRLPSWTGERQVPPQAALRRGYCLPGRPRTWLDEPA